MRWPWLLAALIAAPAANACSVVPGYRIPTNYELVEKAELIVLARVVDGPADPEVSPDDGGPFAERLVIEPVRILKGTTKAERFAWFGMTQWQDDPVPPVVTPLSESHFSAGMGACVRLFYQPGELFVAMFERRNGELVPMGYPWARSAESVDGPDDIWVEAVERYVALSAGATPNRTARLKAEIERTADGPSVADHAIAEDLRRMLEQEKPGAGAAWHSVNSPTQSTALLSETSKIHGSLWCRPGEAGLLVKGADGDDVFTLGIDGEEFAIGRPDDELPDAPASMKAGYARIDNVDALIALLTRPADRAEIIRDGEVVAGAPPADILYRWAKRCTAIIRQTPPSDPSEHIPG